MLSTRVRTCCRARPHIFLPRVNSAQHYARLNSTTAAPPTTPPQKSRSVALTGSLLALAASLGFYGFHVLSSNNTSAASGPLSDQKFTPLKIISSTPASENAKIITLAVPSHLMPDDSALAPIFSFFIKDSDIQVQRPYTPLDGIDENGNMSFWIKRYFDGEVSRWLHNKNIGEELEVRGPVRTFDFKDGDYDEVIMVRIICPSPNCMIHQPQCQDIRWDRRNALCPTLKSHLCKANTWIPITQNTLHPSSLFSESRLPPDYGSFVQPAGI